MTKMTHRCEACGRADSELIYLRRDDRYICEKCLEDDIETQIEADLVEEQIARDEQ